jgi:acetyl esterase/lipase
MLTVQPRAARPSLRYRIAVNLLLRYVARHGTTMQPKRPHKQAAGPRIKNVRITHDTVAGVAVERYLPPEGATRSGCLMFVHGGGFISGTVAERRRWPATVGRRLGIETVSVEYRLAPEHPFPAGPQDIAAVYAKLAENGPVIVAGDSAGGSALLGGLLLSRRNGAPPPALAALLWPVADLTQSSPSIQANEGHDYLTRTGLASATDQYLQGHDPRDPVASPLYADLSWMPPTFFQLGSHDLLLDDGVRLAEQLDAAGVDVTLSIWPQMVHAWASLVRGFPEARHAVTETVTWLNDRLSQPSAPARNR